MRKMSDIVRNQDPVTLPPSATVREASQRMRDRRVGAVLVTDGDRRLVGIFTGRDAVHRVLAEGKSAVRTTLAEVMTPNPDAMPPGKMAIEALRLMEDAATDICRSSRTARSSGSFHGLTSAASSWIASTKRPGCGSAFDSRTAESARRHRSAHDDDGAMGEADYFLSDAPEKEASQATMAATPDDDQISLPVLGYCDDFLGGVAEGGLSRNPRCALRLSLFASFIKLIIGVRENELGRGARDMLQSRVFLDRRIDLWREMWDDGQHA